MSKSLHIPALYILLLVFIQDLSLFKGEKVYINPSLIQSKPNEIKNFSEEADNGADSKYQQERIVRTNGEFISSKTSSLNYTIDSSIDYDSSLANTTIPLTIIITSFGNWMKELGEKGILDLKSNYNDTGQNIFDDPELDENTKFTAVILCDNKYYENISCHLWKKSDEIIYVFCKLNEYFGEGSKDTKMQEVNFIYKNYNISIVSELLHLYFIQYEGPLPFLYYKTQIINVEEGIDTYYLKFKIGCYQNEKLIIQASNIKNLLLDKCSIDKKVLICKIYKSELEEFSLSNNYFYFYYPLNEGGLHLFTMVDQIIINYNLSKVDLKITIGKLVENYVDTFNFFAYKVETNVTNISNFVAEGFTPNFQRNNITIFSSCHFKKAYENPIYFSCFTYAKNLTISLSEIKEEIVLNNSHPKYNFYIQPVKNNEKITIEGPGNFPKATIKMENTLDFYTNDEINLDFFMEEPQNMKGIRINLNASNDLACKDIGKRAKRCIVPKSHFENKQSGYYNIFHLNLKNKYIQYFEISPIQVILPKELIIRIKDINGKNPVKIGKKGTISFKTEFADSDNIFNKLDLEAETANKISFSGNNKIYMADCHLWKPTGENLTLICNFNDSLDTQKIKLNEFIFDYKDYNITLLSENDLNINQLNSTISFLYSDKQVINITDSITEYNLVFKKEVYNKELLILYKGNNNMKNIYLNCREEIKEIKCSISKDKLIGLLSKSGDKFYLSQLTESEGIIKFNSVLDIVINYDKVVKKEIDLSIIKLLTQKVEKNNYIVFETNAASDIQIITTDYFTLNPNKNEAMNCLFRKSNNQNDDKLLLLCNADSIGEYKFDIYETKLDNINILYSFKILESHINDKVNVLENEGTKIISVYPDSLDFTSQDKLTIKYQTENPEKLKDIKLNISSTSNLECTDKKGYKECIVPQNHFNISGYYYTYYTNSFGDKVISYEVPKIQVTVKKVETSKSSNKVGIIVGCVVGGVVLIAAIVIIIIVVKKKKANSEDIAGKIEKVELIEANKFENE